MDALNRLKQKENILKEQFCVERIGIFGSFAKGQETPASDIDMLVEFKKGCSTFDNYIELKFYLEDLYGRKVDLVTNKALKPQIKAEIQKETRYA